VKHDRYAPDHHEANLGVVKGFDGVLDETHVPMICVCV
jgi:hypothetical protein